MAEASLPHLAGADDAGEDAAAGGEHLLLVGQPRDDPDQCHYEILGGKGANRTRIRHRSLEPAGASHVSDTACRTKSTLLPGDGHHEYVVTITNMASHFE